MALLNWLKALIAVFGGQSAKPPSPPRPLSAERAALVAMLDQSWFGLNSHIAPKEYLERFAAAGIKWHRVDMDWNEIEREQGTYDWAAVDAVIDAAAQLELCVLGVIAYTPRWAVPAEHVGKREEQRRAYLPADPATYLTFIDAAVERYRGRVDALSVWNEPNLTQFFQGTRDDYINRLLRPALARIREIAPEVALAGPDLSSAGRPLEWLEAILRATGDLFDVITHHQYDGGDTPEGRAKAIERLREVVVANGYGDRQIWITETGWKGDREGRMLRAMLAQMKARHAWWNKTFWYDSHGGDWGLLGADGASDAGSPYPSFDAYADVIANERSADRSDADGEA